MIEDFNSFFEEGDQNYTLDSIYEIEDLLLVLKEIENKEQYFKGLKQHRIRAIDDKLSQLSTKQELLRAVIQNTMQKLSPKEKTLHFPSIGKITRRKIKGSWNIENEEELKKMLEKIGQKDEVIRITESFDKRKLASVLNSIADQGKPVSGAMKSEDKESLSVTFEKERKPQPEVESAQLSDSKAKLNLDQLETVLI